MKLLIIVTLATLARSYPYRVERVPMSNMDFLLEELFDSSIDAFSINLCPQANIQLHPFEWGM